MSQGLASRGAEPGWGSSWGTYFPPLMSLLRASREITWPQMSLMGGLESEVCCRRMGQANTEWYQHFMPSSISIWGGQRRGESHCQLWLPFPGPSCLPSTAPCARPHR